MPRKAKPIPGGEFGSVAAQQETIDVATDAGEALGVTVPESALTTATQQGRPFPAGLNRPSDRPGEPIQAGLSTGPGATSAAARGVEQNREAIRLSIYALEARLLKPGASAAQLETYYRAKAALLTGE